MCADGVPVTCPLSLPGNLFKAGETCGGMITEENPTGHKADMVRTCARCGATWNADKEIEP